MKTMSSAIAKDALAQYTMKYLPIPWVYYFCIFFLNEKKKLLHFYVVAYHLKVGPWTLLTLPT